MGVCFACSYKDSSIVKALSKSSRFPRYTIVSLFFITINYNLTYYNRKLQKSKLGRSIPSEKGTKDNVYQSEKTPTASMTLSVDSNDEITSRHFKIDNSVNYY